MPTPIDNSIALQAQTPNPMNTIGGIMNFAKGAQELQAGRQTIERGGLALQQETMDLRERKALNELTGRVQKGEFSKQDGEPDYDKMTDAALTAAPKHGMKWVQDIAKTHVESVAARSAINKLSEDQRAAIGQVVTSVADMPFSEQEKAIQNAVKGNTGLSVWADLAVQRLKDAKDDATRKQIALKIGQATMPIAQQLDAMTPGGASFNTGQVSGVTNLKPMAGPVGPVAGTMTQNQLPPTTQVFDPKTNATNYLGPQTHPGSPQAGPALGVPQNVAGTVDTANKDWETTTQSARTASQDIGVLQEIKKYAPGAVKGVGADRRAFLAGIAGLVGMDVGQLEKTDTDLLAKNSNMLALAGGDTNLARSMAEMANPNIHMTEQAIHKAADQVIGQRQMALARQQYLSQFRNDPAKYTSAMTEFNKFADPRILQLASMSPEEKAKMKASMTPKEQKEFGDKIRGLYKIGILQ